MIGELFEKACCDFEFKLKQREPTPVEPTRDPQQPGVVGYMHKSAPLSQAGDSLDSFSTLFRMARIDPQALRARVNFVGDLGRMTVPIEGLKQTAGFGTGALKASVKAEMVDAVRADEGLHDTITAPLKDEITVLRSRLDNLSGEVATEEAVNKSLGGMRKEVEALSKRAIDPVEMRELRKALADQVKANEKLATRLTKLEAKKGG
jgi:hypothetical protein